MKKVTLIFLTLTTATLFVVACRKPKQTDPPETEVQQTPNPVPEPDGEVQTAVDAAWATYVVSDLDMMCAFVGEDVAVNHFYAPIPDQWLDTVNGGFVAIKDISVQKLIMSWNNVLCLDGRRREGSVFIDYSVDNQISPITDKSAYYYRVPGFTGNIQLSAYKVDGWLIKLYDAAIPARVINRVQNYQYSTSATNLVWEISGKFRFIHPSDSNQNMVWDGKIMKTLVNTSDPKVMKPSKDAAITWSLARVSYTGDISGVTTGNVPFKMHIGSNPLIRDFTCSPEKIKDVTSIPSGSVVALTSEHHPFIGGTASFTTGAKDPREIRFGQCGYAGEVLIRGISYHVNFRE